MTRPELRDEAEQCRQRALSYLGKPEAPFLLRVAREFDRLAAEPMNHAGDRSAGKPQPGR
jgi:hypothetical protein